MQVFVNSQSKFHSRKAVEFSMRKKRNLEWEKQELKEKRDEKQDKKLKKSVSKKPERVISQTKFHRM